MRPEFQRAAQVKIDAKEREYQYFLKGGSLDPDSMKPTIFLVACKTSNRILDKIKELPAKSGLIVYRGGEVAIVEDSQKKPSDAIIGKVKKLTGIPSTTTPSTTLADFFTIPGIEELLNI